MLTLISDLGRGVVRARGDDVKPEGPPMRRPLSLSSKETNQAMTALPQEFTPAFRYRIVNGQPVDTEVLDQELWEQTCVVYLRICDGKITYIGSADSTFSKRMRGHLRRIPTSTIRRAESFRKWAEGKVVTVYAYCPPPVKLLGREIKVHRGVEAALIAEFGRKGADEAALAFASAGSMLPSAGDLAFGGISIGIGRNRSERFSSLHQGWPRHRLQRALAADE